MNHPVEEKVSVITIFDSHTGEVRPIKIEWHNRVYVVKKIGYHHKVRMGRTLLHYFSVQSETVYFKLRVDTDNLHWTLEEVYNNESTT